MPKTNESRNELFKKLYSTSFITPESEGRYAFTCIARTTNADGTHGEHETEILVYLDEIEGFNANAVRNLIARTDPKEKARNDYEKARQKAIEAGVLLVEDTTDETPTEVPAKAN